MRLTKKDMPETLYRASRLCRVLGNPTAYLVVRSLGRDRKTPTALSVEIGIPVATVSTTLRHLRQTDLVRYETSGTSKIYWLKDPDILGILDALEHRVDAMRRL